MVMLSSFLISVCFLISITSVRARCYDPSPAFPLPKLLASSPVLQEAFSNITTRLSTLISQPIHSTSSYSIQVSTSQYGTLWETHHTAAEVDLDRPGVQSVDENSVYRAGSITKAFTVLAILQQVKAGNLSLDDTIDQYVAEFRDEKTKGTIPWKDITLRSLAGQMSGIPREFAESDLINIIPDPAAFGLPPIDREEADLPTCDEYSDNFEVPCTKKDLIHALQQKLPLYPPKQKPSYSNINFDLLGLAIENVTGMTYSDYVETSILRPLNMTRSSFAKPKDSLGVLPNGPSYWDVEEGVERPTGALYTTPHDLTLFTLSVLSRYNGLIPELNWLHPTSHSQTLSSSFGLPWEIFRTNKILEPITSRVVTFVTKAGTVPGYSSIMIMVPEYDLGVTIMTAGWPVQPMTAIREIVTKPIILASETIAQNYLAERYTGTFSSSDLNSSITLAHDLHRGLHLTSLISDSTDVLTTWSSLLSQLVDGASDYRLQLTPTLLFIDEKNQRGERWMLQLVPERPEKGQEEEVWDDFCIGHDDGTMYAGKPLLEFVFWDGADTTKYDDGGTRMTGSDKRAEFVELTGFRVKVARSEIGLGGEGSPADQKMGGEDLLQRIQEQLRQQQQRVLGEIA